ncbi:hypothetical protein [Streptomyces sp. MspMP-M5]|uniref:zinc finger domain-containing protein n=1 Tax=Streptomyces sp. MspMP-M5 TaxID=1155718 RepID=UPI000A306F90
MTARLHSSPADADDIERHPCPRCAVKSGSPCRSGGGYHTGRFTRAPRLAKLLHVAIPTPRVGTGTEGRSVISVAPFKISALSCRPVHIRLPPARRRRRGCGPPPSSPRTGDVPGEGPCGLVEVCVTRDLLRGGRDAHQCVDGRGAGPDAGDR